MLTDSRSFPYACRGAGPVPGRQIRVRPPTPFFAGLRGERGAMPMFDFECSGCGRRFEELMFDDDTELPCCPSCGSSDTRRLLSTPSPLKKNPFPYKIGPVNQAFVDNARRAEALAAAGKSPCAACGGACPHAGGGEGAGN